MTTVDKNHLPERGLSACAPDHEQGLGRREFLKMVGLGTAALGAGSAVGLHAAAGALSVVPEEEFPAQGPESRVVSFCGLCPARCGMIVRKIGERAVKVEGNPLDPTNQGGLCPIGQAILQLVYNPDRVRSPLKRVGDRGSNTWQTITWQDALGLIKAKLDQIRAGAGAHTVAVVSGGTSELAGRLMARFLEAYGSPNFILEKAAAPSHGQDLTQGVSGRVAYDFENARYILSFGAPLLEAMSPVRQMRVIGEFRQGWLGRRGKLVQIESRMSATAAKADEWVPVNPGTEGVLALGIANALVKYHLYDAAFAASHVAGFDTWGEEKGGKAGGFNALVLEQYDAPKCSEITGVPVETITRLAHEFAISGPALAVPGDPKTSSRNPAFSFVAVQALNALAGNIGKPGGVLVCQDPPLASWPPLSRSASASRAAKMPLLDDVGALASAVWEEKPYPINALFLLGANPIFSAPNLPRETLARIPFIASFASLLDETAMLADIVLPDCTSLECCELRTRTPGFALTSVGVASPAVAPRHNSRPAAQAILDLARSFGGEIAAAFPWSEPSDALRKLLAGLWTCPHGEVFTERFQSDYLRPELRAWEWPARKFASRDDFIKLVVLRGGWVDPRYAYGDLRSELKTASGKFELPRLLATDASAPVFHGGDSSAYPLDLCIFQPLALMSEVSENLPYLQEIAGAPQEWPWDSFVEINPRTAASLGIGNGDWVIVQSPAGKVKTRARLFAGAMPNVVNLPLGQGHTALGRWARNRGINPLDLLASGAAPRVRVSKA